MQSGGLGGKNKKFYGYKIKKIERQSVLISIKYEYNMNKL